MRVIFCKSNTVVGFLLRLATFSKWSHVALEYNDQVIESTMLGGVSQSEYAEFIERQDETSEIDVSDVNKIATWVFIKSQIGKGYDWKAIVSFPFRRSWQDNDRWFCSEVVAAALIRGGKHIKLSSNRVTPRDLWVLL